MVGVQSLQVGKAISAIHPHHIDQLERGRVAELRRLRVAEALRGRGLATSLCRMVITWTTRHQYRTLVVNTTTPQTPALQLYRKLGFREVGISYLDRYELTWWEFKV
jgi:GNAT superfamily N-acetyltransferase